MKTVMRRLCGVSIIIAILLVGLTVLVSAADDPLPSWNDGAAKRGIVKFVTQATEEGGPNYVPAC